MVNIHHGNIDDEGLGKCKNVPDKVTITTITLLLMVITPYRSNLTIREAMNTSLWTRADKGSYRYSSIV
ncbi:MAG: hypothetical protein ACW99G_09885 [Candidatus Thorarchaeota archaeon]|jgi:hypothetical protein